VNQRAILLLHFTHPINKMNSQSNRHLRGVQRNRSPQGSGQAKIAIQQHIVRSFARFDKYMGANDCGINFTIRSSCEKKLVAVQFAARLRGCQRQDTAGQDNLQFYNKAVLVWQKDTDKHSFFLKRKEKNTLRGVDRAGLRVALRT